MVPLIDTHAHLQEIEDLPGAMARACQAGVEAVIVVGSDLASNQRALDLATEYGTRVYPALGIHPWNLEETQVEPTLRFIKHHIHHAVALGEIGLDYWLKEARKPGEGRTLQREVLAEVLHLATRFAKPVSIHARGAWQDALELVIEAHVTKAVFHWYSGPLHTLDALLDRGFLISATPAVRYSPHHQEAVRRAPLGQILLETDSPVAYEGKKSEPADLLLALDGVARLKNLDREEVASTTTQNALTFFGLEDRRAG